MSEPATNEPRASEPTTSEPDVPGQGLGGEAAHHVAYLDLFRADVLHRVQALSTEQQRSSVLPSGWTPLELLSHLLHMERRWFVWGFLGEAVDRPWGDSDDPWGVDPDRDAPWSVPPDVGVAELAERLARQAETTRRLLAEVPLATVAATGGRFAATTSESAEPPPDLRWICFHVLREYAQHAGHLDAALELLHAGP